MRRYLISNEGNFYKANIHGHSIHSDGKYTPEHIKEIYQKQGYSIFCLTDHNVFVKHNELSDDNFLFLNGLEVNIDRNDMRWPRVICYHINFYATNSEINEFIPFENKYTLENVNQIIKRAKENGFIANYNHPKWSLQTINDYKDLENLWGFEVYNNAADVDMLIGEGIHEYFLKCFYNSLENKLDDLPNVTANDDNHNLFLDETSPYNESFGGFTMIKAKSLKYEDVIKAMLNNNVYASNGAYIYELYIEDGYVYIKTSPVNCIYLQADSRSKVLLRSNIDDLTEGKIKIPDNAKFIRVEIRNSKYQKAYTKAYKI